MPVNTSEITIKARPQKVWDALTKPELVKQWQYGSELTTDWQVGSEIRFKSEWEGKTFEQWGEVLEVIPKKKLRYSLFALRPGLEDKPENYFIMEYRLKENDGVVKLEIIREDNRPGAVQEEPDEGENPILNTLKSLVES